MSSSAVKNVLFSSFSNSDLFAIHFSLLFFLTGCPTWSSACDNQWISRRHRWLCWAARWVSGLAGRCGSCHAISGNTKLSQGWASDWLDRQQSHVETYLGWCWIVLSRNLTCVRIYWGQLDSAFSVYEYWPPPCMLSHAQAWGQHCINCVYQNTKEKATTNLFSLFDLGFLEDLSACANVLWFAFMNFYFSYARTPTEWGTVY